MPQRDRSQETVIKQRVLLALLPILVVLMCATKNPKLEPLSDQERCIEGGDFLMGSNSHYPEEKHQRRVHVDSFCIDTHEVTNAEFSQFVAATGYRTVAELGPRPENYPGLDASYLKKGSAVFVQPSSATFPSPSALSWWKFVEDATWQTPTGPDSSIEKLERHPVVHIAFEDAMAYARWRGRDLPTEEEWEYAAWGGTVGSEYAWGDERAPAGTEQANTWQGTFPIANSVLDGFAGTSPVGSFPSNGFGLFDMIGNVWEWTSTKNGSNNSLRTIKGGSFLCAESYCARFRPAAKQFQETGLGTSHLGFRTVRRK